MADGGYLEKSIKPYICKGLTNWREIWHSDAYWPSERYCQLKFRTLKNPIWRTAVILKNKKTAMGAKFGNVVHICPVNRIGS